MSLLLDALKKSGDKSPQSTGLSNLTLEDAAPSRTPSGSSAATVSSRAAGEAMFSSKKKKNAGFRWNLGLVPTTLLIALLFGSGYGYYVWLEIQPPKQQHVVQRVVSPPSIIAPIVTAAPAPALVPFIPAQEKTTFSQPQKSQSLVTARNEDFDEPRSKTKSNRIYNKPTTTGLSVQRKLESDNVLPALLDAYQSYQRGDYVSATQGYREVLNKDVHNRDALLGLAAIALQQGQEESAQHYYRQLLVLDPHDPAAQAALISYAPETVNTESRLKLLLADQPRSSALHFALGNYYSEQSDWGNAQQYYFNAHTLEPSNAQFTFNFAVSLDHLGQRKLATKYYQLALQLDASGNSGFDHAQAQQRLNELTLSH